MKEHAKIKKVIAGILAVAITATSVPSAIWATGYSGTTPTLNKETSWVADDIIQVNLTLDAPKDNVKLSTADIVVVFDCSGSMETLLNGSSRLSVAKDAVKDFTEDLLSLNALAASGNGNVRVGLVTFADSATVSQTFTSDATTMSNSINKVKIAPNDNTGIGRGTNTSAGILKAQDMLDSSTADYKYVVLITDGEPTFSMKGTSTDGAYITEFGNETVGNGREFTFGKYEIKTAISSSTTEQQLFSTKKNDPKDSQLYTSTGKFKGTLNLLSKQGTKLSVEFDWLSFDYKIAGTDIVVPKEAVNGNLINGLYSYSYTNRNTETTYRILNVNDNGKPTEDAAKLLKDDGVTIFGIDFAYNPAHGTTLACTSNAAHYKNANDLDELSEMFGTISATIKTAVAYCVNAKVTDSVAYENIGNFQFMTAAPYAPSTTQGSVTCENGIVKWNVGTANETVTATYYLKLVADLSTLYNNGNEQNLLTNPAVLEYSTSQGDSFIEQSDVNSNVDPVAVTVYKVQFNVNGNATTFYVRDGKGVTPPVVTETATLSFKGWFTASGSQVTDFSKITADISVTAEFANKTAEIKFYNEAGTELLNEANTTYTIGAAVTAPTAPDKASDVVNDYTFAGWTTTKGGTDILKTIPDASADATYYAAYTPTAKTYTVTVEHRYANGQTDTEYIYGQYNESYSTSAKALAGTAALTFNQGVLNANSASASGTITGNALVIYDYSYINYTITFEDKDGNTIPAYTLSNQHYGDTISVPQLPAITVPDAQYIASQGWSPEVSTTIAGNATYKATYDIKDKATFTVTWTVGSDSVSGTYYDGQSFIMNTAVPSKDSDATYNYNFLFWTENGQRATFPTTVTENHTYVAAFDQTPVVYTVVYDPNNGGNKLSLPYSLVNGQTEPSSTLLFPTNPEKAATALYTYIFNGWGTPVISADGLTKTYTAVYNEVANVYTVIYDPANGTNVETKTYTPALGGTEPSSTAFFPTNPEKAADVSYTYTFNSWSEPVVSTDGFTKTYTAVYDSEKNVYTVVYDPANGTAEKSDTYIPADGETEPSSTAFFPTNPEKAATVEYTYTFNGWGTPVVSADGFTKTYTAVYDAAQNVYTVIYDPANGTDVETRTYTPALEETEPSSTAFFPTNPEKAATVEYTYTFNSWGTPVVSTDGFTKTYTAVYDAEKNVYTVVYDPANGTAEKSDTYVPADGETEPSSTAFFPTNPEKTATVEYTYAFNSWGTPSISDGGFTKTYTAIYDATKNVYTVVYNPANGTAEKSDTYIPADGETEPSSTAFFPTNPEKTATVEYTYTFNGWGTPVVSADGFTKTYTAVYDSEMNVYTVVYDPANGSQIITRTYTPALGETEPSSTDLFPTNPEKTATVENTYAFRNWGEPVISDNGFTKTYTAVYDASPIFYTIRFLGKDSTISEELYKYNSNVVVPPNPSDYNEDYSEKTFYTYTFKGWYDGSTLYNVTVPNVTANTDYTANYDRTENNKYVITWKFENGTPDRTDYYMPGENIIVPNDPVKESDNEFIYYFSNWSYNQEPISFSEEDPTTATGDATFTAVYETEDVLYNVVYLDYDGTELKSEYELKYGELSGVTAPANPKRPSEGSKIFTFDGWDLSVDETTYVYTATYTNIVVTVEIVTEATTTPAETMEIPDETDPAGEAPETTSEENTDVTVDIPDDDSASSDNPITGVELGGVAMTIICGAVCAACVFCGKKKKNSK